MLNRIFIFIILVTGISYSSISQSDPLDLKSLDQYIEHARIQWEVPGMSVTIVHQGKTLLSKGYGIGSIHHDAPVDASTLFMIGSTTKAMTAMAMGMLVDEEKVEWSDKVIDHLPWFRLSDPYVTSSLTIKDLFTHNSGLGNTDLLWLLWDYSAEDMVKRLAKVPLSYDLRDGYRYQNLMYATAGLVIESVSGIPWEDFVTLRIFSPLGMDRTCALKSCAEKESNRARAHYKMQDAIVQIVDTNADSIGAAGSVWSCSEDIAKWMKFVLAEGVINHPSKEPTRLISKESFNFINKPHIIVPYESFYPSKELTQPNFTAYSMGWFLHDYEGEFVQFHTGSLNGTGAIIGLVPAQDLGVYVMVNLEDAEVRHALIYQIFDSILDLGNRDWSTDLKKIYDQRAQYQEDRHNAMIHDRIPNQPSDITESEIIGKYKNEILGIVEIVKGNNPYNYVINCRSDKHLGLKHWHYNTYIGALKEYPHDRGDLMDFDRDANGKISLFLYGYVFEKE
jgi:CubicO group peptidase (beta-lactamase class C family)